MQWECVLRVVEILVSFILTHKECSLRAVENLYNFSFIIKTWVPRAIKILDFFILNTSIMCTLSRSNSSNFALTHQEFAIWVGESLDIFTLIHQELMAFISC